MSGVEWVALDEQGAIAEGEVPTPKPAPSKPKTDPAPAADYERPPQGTSPWYGISWITESGRREYETRATIRSAQKLIAKMLKPQHVKARIAPDGHVIQPARTIPAVDSVRFTVGYTVKEEAVEITSADEVVAPPKRRRPARDALGAMKRPR